MRLNCLCCMQVVVTDVEECMEAMHENVNVNLPKHCQLQPGIWRAPITHSSAAVNSSEQPQAHTTTTAQHQAPSAEAPALPGDADLHGIQTARTSISAVEHSSQAEGQHSAGTEARQHSTTVHVAELDWAQDPAFLHPPFDVVLIADVVRHQISPCLCLPHCTCVRLHPQSIACLWCTI